MFRWAARRLATAWGYLRLVPHLLVVLYNPGRFLFGSSNEPQALFGDASPGSKESRWFTTCEVCGKTMRKPEEGEPATHEACAAAG